MTIRRRGRRPRQRFGVLRTIALYKLVKVILLLLAPMASCGCAMHRLSAKLLSWASSTPYGLEHASVDHLLGWFSGLSSSRIYAAPHRDPGLCRGFRRRGDRPVDAAALGGVADDHHHRLADSVRGLGASLPADIGKVLVLVANVAVVGYLVWHVRKTQASRGSCHCEMIFISVQLPDSVVFSQRFTPTTFGDLMNKSATLITTALLTLGLPPPDGGRCAEERYAGGRRRSAPAPKAKSHKTSSKKHKKSTAAPTATK